jgi:uncharacterized protein (TIGR02466 family)
MIHNINAFPTLIKVVPSFLNKAQCEDIISLYREKYLDNHYTLSNGSKSSHGQDVYALDEIEKINSCKNIKQILLNIIKEYSNETGLIHTTFGNSWINFQNKGSKLEKHTHPLSVISGAIYLNVDEDSSKICFYNPNPFIDFSPIKECTEYTYKHITITPNNGDMILFPSWLLHGSNEEVNYTSERVVVSFNTSPF